MFEHIAPVVYSKLLLTCFPSCRFWRSTLIDFEAPTNTLRASELPPPPPRMHILEHIFGSPQRFALPPPIKIPAGAHAYTFTYYTK